MQKSRGANSSKAKFPLAAKTNNVINETIKNVIIANNICCIAVPDLKMGYDKIWLPIRTNNNTC